MLLAVALIILTLAALYAATHQPTQHRKGH